MQEIIYDVFARKDRGDALAHIGYVDALDDATARVYAWSAIIPVNRDDGPFARGASA